MHGASSQGYAGVYHVYHSPDWLGSTGFYDDDLRFPLEQNESKTWEPICVWATPTHAPDTMFLTFEASAALAPPPHRQYLLELLSVPDGVTGAPVATTSRSGQTSSGAGQGVSR